MLGRKETIITTFIKITLPFILYLQLRLPKINYKWNGFFEGNYLQYLIIEHGLSYKGIIATFIIILFLNLIFFPVFKVGSFYSSVFQFADSFLYLLYSAVMSSVC